MRDITGLPQLVLRVALGIGFLLPVADRLGFLGPNGAANVAWGDWNHFVGYTNTLAPFLPHTLANIAAMLVTIAESVFGICLLIGFKIKQAASGAAILTFIFGLSMAIFVGIAAPFLYPVFVFTGSAWVLACVPHHKWSIDDYIHSKTIQKP